MNCLLVQEIILVRVFSTRPSRRIFRFLNVFIARKSVENVRDLLCILLTYNHVLIILLYLPPFTLHRAYYRQCSKMKNKIAALLACFFSNPENISFQ